MKAVLYELTITDSMMDALHGGYYRIKEIFIPEINVHINQEGVWESNKERYKHENHRTGKSFGRSANPLKIKDIELEDDLKEKLLLIVKARKDSKAISEYFKPFYNFDKCTHCRGDGYIEVFKNEESVRLDQCKVCDRGKITLESTKRNKK